MTRLTVLLVVGALALAGCAGERIYFRPTEDVSDPSLKGLVEAQYVVTGPKGETATIEVASQGRYANEVEGMEVDTIHVVFDVDNDTELPFVLLLGHVEAIDDDGNRLTRVSAYRQGEMLRELAVLPDKSLKAQVFFDLPRGAAFAAMGSFRLRWAYRYDGKVTRVETKFLKIERTETYWPGYGSYGHRYRRYGYDRGYYYPGYWDLGPRGFYGPGLYHDHRFSR